MRYEFVQELNYHFNKQMKKILVVHTDFWNPFIYTYLCISVCVWSRDILIVGGKSLITRGYLITGEVSQLDVSSRGRNNTKTQPNGGHVQQKRKGTYLCLKSVWVLTAIISQACTYTYTVMLKSSIV